MERPTITLLPTPGSETYTVLVDGVERLTSESNIQAALTALGMEYLMPAKQSNHLRRRRRTNDDRRMEAIRASAEQHDRMEAIEFARQHHLPLDTVPTLLTMSHAERLIFAGVQETEQ